MQDEADDDDDDGDDGGAAVGRAARAAASGGAAAPAAAAAAAGIRFEMGRVSPKYVVAVVCFYLKHDVFNILVLWASACFNWSRCIL